MAETELTVKVAVIAGTDIGAGTNVLAANNGKFLNDGKTILKVVNGGGASRDVIFVSEITVGNQSLAVADHTVSVTNAGTAERYIGPFPTGIYNNGGYVFFTVDTNDLTFTAIRTP
jgi:hypothetical protein